VGNNSPAAIYEEGLLCTRLLSYVKYKNSTSYGFPVLHKPVTVA